MICEPTSITSLDGNYGFPLYLYTDTKGQQTLYKTITRVPNLNLVLIDKISNKLGLKFTNEKETKIGTFAPIDLLDYICAVLHCKNYRKKYKEFLKIDFPRVPYPKDQDTFWKLVKLGGELRQVHLLESSLVENLNTSFPVSGSNEVSKKLEFTDNKVYINQEQYFDAVTEIVWNFFIGGYQPAQKWLKDRKGRILSDEDIIHYQKIIVALTETDRLMKEIDKIDFMEDDSRFQYQQSEGGFQIAADSGN
jgi:predicted helicase